MSEASAKAYKEFWLNDARRSFVPSDRAPCAVCGKFQAVAQAHHIIPLAAQFDAGFTEPCHRHVWLCPTHHAAVHLIIAQISAKRFASSENVSDLIAELHDHGHGRVILDLAAFGLSQLHTGGALRLSDFISP